MKTEKLFRVFFLAIMFSLNNSVVNASTIGDTTFLRVSVHIFNDEEGRGNFNPDSTSHLFFLEEVIDRINFQLLNLKPLAPAMPSEYIKSTGIQIRIDSFFFHKDNYAWDCSEDIDSYYMRSMFVDADSSLDYKQKYQTLPIFIGSNYNIIGGHNSLIGDKRFIAMRGLYNEYQSRAHGDAVRDCSRGILHELGHSLGLSHNFSGGPSGDQCDECDDNGCPQEGSSNNIMDYWPNYGYALSACQVNIIREYLSGSRGNISDVIWNDSCYASEEEFTISVGQELVVNDTLYVHGDLIVETGGRLTVSGYLSFASEKRLIIQPGAEVFIQGGTLGNLCGDLWGGIRVMDSAIPEEFSRLIVRGGVIENARIGISSEINPFVILKGVSFRNNVLALDLNGNRRYDGAIVDSCRFEVTSEINHSEEGELPAGFVNIRQKSKVVFNNCDFVNEEGHRKYNDEESGIGILVENSSIFLNGCSFKNLFKGIYATSGSPDCSLDVVSSRFELCHCGIQLNAFPKASVRSSIFSLNRLNSLPSIGIHANGVSFLAISDNLFYSDYGGKHLSGIFTDHSFPGTHLVENNQFEKIHSGIIINTGSDLPDMPADMFNKTSDELIREPLGTIWNGNTFKDVENEELNIYPDQSIMVYGQVKDYNLLDVSSGKMFSEGGFAPLSRKQKYFVRLENGNNHNYSGAGNIFFLLNDSSWPEINVPSLTIETLPAFISKLSMQYFKGMDFRSGDEPLSFEGLVLLGRHLKSYPWLAVLPSFKSYILEQTDKIPVWFWDEIEQSLIVEDPWKTGINQVLIFLAQSQIENSDSSNYSVKYSYSPSQLNAAFSPINMMVISDLAKLNTGINYNLHSGFFSVVPNPNNGQFGIKPEKQLLFADSEVQWNYRILTIEGKIVTEGFIFNAQELLLDIRPVEAGSYLLEIWSDNEFLGVKKFIILPD